jgi:hypothetical protein
MTTTKRRLWRVLAEAVLFMLAIYLGGLLFSMFEPTLVRGVMRGLRIFLGVVVFVLGAFVFYLTVQRFVGKPHYELRFGALFLITGPLEYFGAALVLDALFVG